MRAILRPLSLAIVFAATAARALDPPYQPQMERLAEIMGALYHLDDLCMRSGVDWRSQLAELMELDEVDNDRRARLAGAFNANYSDFQQTP